MQDELHTERLLLRRFEIDDAPFVLRLLNEPSFLRFIGDRGVRTIGDAERYIAAGPQQSYRALGTGLLLVEVKPQRGPIGMCGLMQKPWLDAPDLAYAFVPEAGGQGYALEAARTVLESGRARLGIDRVVAVVTPDNLRSIRVLEKLGFHDDGETADPATGEALRRFCSVSSPVERGPGACTDTAARP